MLPEQIVYIGVLATIIGSSFYLKGIIFGSIRPNLVSHFIWCLAPFIGVFFQIKAGAGLSVLPIFTAGLTSLFIIAVSVLKKNGYWKINAFDLVCGLTSLIALVLYILTHNLSISILFAITSDALAYIPTIKKTWSFPDTETGSIYVSGIFSNTLGLLTIKLWIFPIYSFSISIIIWNLLIIFLIYRKKIFRIKTEVIV
jgi:hypothetical protein